jgi:hypothetical protein
MAPAAEAEEIIPRLVVVFLARDALKSGRDAKGKIDIDFFAVIVSGNL